MSDRSITRIFTSEQGERGSIMILTLGFIVMCIMAVAVVVDASAMFLARRSLQAAVDSAALAGAQAIDREAYYHFGAGAGVRLDPQAVRAAVRDQLATSTGVRLDFVRVDGANVVVQANTRVRPPFSGWLTPSGAHTITVQAGARLSYRPAS
jgi:uncharacterized membrane protein